MKTVLFVVLGCLWGAQSHALTISEAQSIVRSPTYVVYDTPMAVFDDDGVAKVKAHLAAERYADALEILETLDQQDGFEGVRVHFLPDIALVALAAGDTVRFEQVQDLVLDIEQVYRSDAHCEETESGYDLIASAPLKLTRQTEVKGRICNAFTIGRQKAITLSTSYVGKIDLLR